jgi:hypothetical protein
MVKSVRNLIIFTIVTLGGGFLGIALDRLSPPSDPLQGLGALVWLVSPLAAHLLLRAFAGDGWADFGLGPNLRAGWIWYPVAVAIPLLVTLTSLALGIAAGGVSLSSSALPRLTALLPLVMVGFGGAMVKNIFEEFAWRGYLTPRFEAMGLHPFVNSLLTGLLWAGWHVPYYLYYLDRSVLQAHTSLPLPVFILLAFLVLPFHALAYGELRFLSKSVWPVWLMHTVANAVSLPLISEGFVTLRTGFQGALLSPATAGIVHSLLMGAIGYVLYRRRQRNGS